MNNENVKIDQRFIVQLQGKDFVTYEGLLDLAHQKGLVSIDIEIIQIPTKDNDMTAICKATAKTQEMTYIDIGDASPGSVSRNLVPHIIRMASTRAKARALRDLTNVGMTALEEMDISNEFDKAKDSKITSRPRKQQTGQLSEGQIKRLYAIAYSKKIDANTVKAQIAKRYKKKPEQLTREEYDIVCKGYEDMR